MSYLQVTKLPTHSYDTINDKDILDLLFISPLISALIIPHFRDFCVGEDLGSDHSTIIGVYELPTKIVMLYHKADTNTMTTLDIQTSTIQDIDSYVNPLTDIITKTIDDKFQSKTLKPNSVGLPQAIRNLIKEKRGQRRYWQQT